MNKTQKTPSTDMNQLSPKPDQNVSPENTVETEPSVQHTTVQHETTAMNSKQDEKQISKKSGTQSYKNTQHIEQKKKTNQDKEQTEIKQKQGSGKGLSLLAILITLGLAASGYYYGMQKYTTMQQQVDALQQQITQLNSHSQSNDNANNVNMMMAELKQAQQQQSDKLSAAEQQLVQTNQELTALNNRLELEKAQYNELRNKINNMNVGVADSTGWIMASVNFLLKNAQHKLTLDGDIGTTISLLQEANDSLMQLKDSQAIALRAAINQDIDQLRDINEVDQEFVMAKLSQLISAVDNLTILSPNTLANDDSSVSDSIDDWQSNLEKSANSFLNHFISIKRKDANAPELLAPNQDIYLKENIRLSLQTALSAVPRQQNEVYKQSLNSIAVWLRSYFDTENTSVKQFLQQVELLKDQVIYTEPPQLSSVKLYHSVFTSSVQSQSKLTTQEKTTSEDKVTTHDATPSTNNDVSTSE